MMRSWQRWLVTFAFVAAAVAQETLEVTGPVPATVVLGDVARVNLEIVGPTANPKAPRLPTVAGLQMQLYGPSRSEEMRIENGRRTSRVTVIYQILLKPGREGSFVIPAFPIETGSRTQQVPEMKLEVSKDLQGGDRGWLEVRTAPRRAYVHEPIRIHVELGVQQGLRIDTGILDRHRYLDIEVQAPWMTEIPGCERLEEPAPEGETRPMLTNAQLFHASYDPGYERGGKTWHRFSFDRYFLPVRPGVLELPAPTLRFSVLRREGQTDFFGNVRGREAENLFVYGQPVSIEILPIPEEGRPTPYFGAVGRFAIAAALDPGTVTVGDSVRLRLTVTGQGNFEFLRLPELNDLEGFHLLGEAEAERGTDKVVVSYDLKVLSTEVTAVPAIGWNFFDTTPGVERFVEVATEPLRLDVRPLANGETLAALPNGDTKAITAGVDDVYDLPRFDGPARVRDGPSAAWSWFAVIGPWGVVLLAVLGFSALRRRAADVAGQRARGAQRGLRGALSSGTEPVDAFAGYLGDRFDVPAAAVIRPDLRERLVEAGLDEALASEVAVTIERGTTARYGGGEPLAAAEVTALAERLEPVRLRRGAWTALGLLSVLAVSLGLAPTVSAQELADRQAPHAEAIALYRAADYAAADAAFATAFERTGDRRLLQARGNCLFRLGELPRALWAYESARLGSPRDPELLANIELVRARLDVPPPPAGFLAELGALQRQLAPGERLLLLGLCMLVAALCLVAGWRRAGLRWVGVIALIPGVWFAIELCWLGPARPPSAIALQKVAITSEPRADLEPVATVRAGVELELLGSTAGRFARVRVGDRSGYVAADVIAVVE